MGEKITKRQKEILDFICQYQNERGYAPSYREIGQHFKLSSSASVAEHVQNLREKGYLDWEEGAARSIEVLEKPKTFATAFMLPLAGLITAGQPIEALQTNDTIAVPAQLVKDESNTYVLKVKGQSMIDEGILDGDFVVVERNPSPRNGQVVVALLDNAFATLKKFYREPDRIRLQPANTTMKPIYAKDVNIQGVVTAIIRKFATV